LVRTLPPEVFFPRPEVDSAVVKLERRPVCVIAPSDFTSFQEFVRRAFQQRRKKLSSTLGIADSRRPEEVGVEEWINLWQQKVELGSG
jgi:16S rRNA (adenine1518-N6/adenine1519-N6)-dimethyltransferase